jgi:hypothetical protein
MPECPRWRLLQSHYINIAQLPDGTKIEWEHKETNRESGRAVRKLYPVPMLLNPEDPGDQNYPGEIVVTQEVEGATPRRQDLIMFGPPTRDMEPMNDEAEAISDSLRARWINPVETLPSNGGMDDKEMAFFKTMMSQFGGSAQPAPAQVVSRAEYDELKAKLDAVLATQPKADTPAGRRV